MVLLLQRDGWMVGYNKCVRESTAKRQLNKHIHTRKGGYALTHSCRQALFFRLMIGICELQDLLTFPILPDLSLVLTLLAQ